jgi:predicted amidohydrolase
MSNLQTMVVYVEQVAGQGVDLVVFPEYSHCHYSTPHPRWAASHTALDGPFVSGLIEAAARHGVTVVAGIIESNGASKPFNTQIVANGLGLVAISRKIHLYDAFSMRESDFFSPSPEEPAQVFTAGGMTLGVQTCYDLRFPEVTRRLIDRGADVVIIPAQWVPGPHKLDQWVTLARARAIEGQVWVVAAAHPRPTGVGASLVISPQGEVVAQAGEDHEVLTQVLTKEPVDRVREHNPMATARRLSVTWG